MMLTALVGMVGFLAAITLCGYLITLYFAKDAGVSFLVGSSFPLGACYYVACFVVINTLSAGATSHLLPFAALFAAAGIVTCAGGIRCPLPASRTLTLGPCLPILLTVIVLSSLKGMRFLVYDTPIHFQFAAEIAAGKFPPSLPGTFDVPFPYHTGYNILFGSIAALTGGNFIDIYLFVTLLFVFSIVMLLYSLLNAMTSHRVFSAISTLPLMMGTSFLGLPWHGVALYYRLADMMQQHPWKFAVFIVLLIVATALKSSSINMRRFFIVIVPLLPFTGYLAVQVIPFAVVGIFALYVFTYFRFHDKMSYLKTGAFFLLLVVCIIAVLHMGGAFEKDEAGNFLNLSYSLQSVMGFFRIHDYHNGTAGKYYFLDTTFALAGYTYIFVTVSKKITSHRATYIFQGEKGLSLFLVSVGFFWYISPMFLRFNIEFWDNFCKFNYVGVIIGMLCFVFMVYKLYMIERYKRLVATAFAVFLVSLIVMQARYDFRGVNIWEARADLAKYQVMIKAVQRLNPSEGFVVYGVPNYVAYRLGINLLNPASTFNLRNRYAYIPHKVTPDIDLLAASGVRYIVAANDTIPQVERILHNNIKLHERSGDGRWAIYTLLMESD